MKKLFRSVAARWKIVLSTLVLTIALTFVFQNFSGETANPPTTAPSIPTTVRHTKFNHRFLSKSAENEVGEQASCINNGLNMVYHGGELSSSRVYNIYLIFYGSQFASTTESLVENYAKTVGGTPYLDINTNYCGAGGCVKPGLTYAGEYGDTGYSQGTNLSLGGVHNVVQNAIVGGHLPADSWGIYVVLADKTVTGNDGNGNFCSTYCAYHTSATWSDTSFVDGVNILYTFVGSALACGGCTVSSPNNNVEADSMINSMSHEVSETLTDFNGDAWVDGNGCEMADKCNFEFGPNVNTVGQPYADLKISSTYYQVQQLWAMSPSSQYCAMVGPPTAYCLIDNGCYSTTACAGPTTTSCVCNVGQTASCLNNYHKVGCTHTRSNEFYCEDGGGCAACK